MLAVGEAVGSCAGAATLKLAVAAASATLWGVEMVALMV